MIHLQIPYFNTDFMGINKFKRRIFFMSNVYLIDYENIKDFKGVVDNNESSKQYLFYTNACPNISLDVIANYRNMEFIKVLTGNQSLDMCLSSYIGFLIASNPEDKYIIVSNDSDYDTTVNFWRTRGIGITKTTQMSERSQHNLAIVDGLHKTGIKGQIVGEIASIVAKTYKLPKGKQKIYIELIKKYGKVTGGQYYHAIRKII